MKPGDRADVEAAELRPLLAGGTSTQATSVK
jgi:hypothetical protein